jgi:hypothetical protein
MNDFEEMRELLKEIVIIQNQQAKMLLRHSEMLVEHDRRMAEHDERMERIGRHLEVLASMTDDLIRNKADRKRH